MATSVALWTWRALARRPWVWFLGLGLAAWWPLQGSLAPFTLVADSGARPEALVEAVSLALLVGTAAGLSIWRDGAALFATASTPRRIGAESLSLLLAATTLEAGVWAVALTAAPEPARNALEIGFPGAQLRKLHLVAWGSLLLRLPAATPVRLVLLVSAGWVLPTLLLDAGAPGAVFSGPVRAFSEGSVPVTKGAVIEALAPIGAVWLASALLARPGHPSS